MLFSLYSLRDAKVGYLTPFPMQSDAAASRSFVMTVANTEEMRRFATDFDLIRIGTFDSEKGIISGTDPVVVLTGVSALIQLQEVKNDGKDEA